MLLISAVTHLEAMVVVTYYGVYMKKNIIIGLSIVVVIGIFVYQQKQSSLIQGSPENTEASMTDETTPIEETATPTDMATESAEVIPVEDPTPEAAGLTTATVALHNSRTSCWTIINGAVYDLTGWIPKHPGGEQAILQLCGIDGSAKYNRQHGGGKKQATILAGFKIGILE
ncbi:cytochrome b5 domain-containing protein [Candidatus Kaiserbacteria bacterium]|nr:cytochrome b5 domain-containing protein [Candidatus Kaiserbacteria bacterium]